MDTPPSESAPAVEVVCVGECMVMFVPERRDRTRPDLPVYVPTAAGAESNVAAFLASLDVQTAWVSRVGADPFGDFLLNELAGLGVHVTGVARDARRNTGVAFKEIHEGWTSVQYYREGSAASAMDASTRLAAEAIGGRLTHLSGITPALSDSCEELARTLAHDRPAGHLLSFDVNWRPSLWRQRDPSALIGLARAADIVFVGDDEAQALWGTSEADAVRDLLPDVPTLVVKHGPRGATVFSDGTCLFVPSLRVDVVEVVGAGDAFAAGFLAGTLAGRELRDRARLGTIVAGSALQVTSDIGPLPPTAEIDALLALSEEEWCQAGLASRSMEGG